MKPATLIAVVLLSVVAFAHAVRLVFQTEVVIGGMVTPMWISVLGVVVPALLAVGLFREGQSSDAGHVS